uniref:Transmembrane protein 254 n=2 Tax=Xenopus tropicalis TaxID=8364 RepID=A0A6I8PUS7_XENTR
MHSAEGAAVNSSTAMASNGGSTYFQRASLFWMVVIALSMGFFAWTVFWPATVPYKILGPLGSFAAYMVKNHPTLLYYGFWGAWIVHLLEAVYSAWLCRSKGITETSVQALWVVQTFFFGISSLSLLLAYNPGLTKKMR